MDAFRQQGGQSLESERTQRLIAMGQMAASLAHEIRNPLGSMKLYCSLLDRDLCELPDQQVLAKRVLEGIVTLERVISNCLQFARVIKPKFTAVRDVSAFIKKIVNSLEPLGSREIVTIEVQGDLNQEIWLDTYQMQQVLINLLTNALESVSQKKEEGAGDYRPQVVVRSEVFESGSWQLRIIDNGMGIALGDEARLFDPFYSTKSKGTGLGLSIVHMLVNAHGGSLEIKPREDGASGASVIVSLPQYQRDQAIAV